MFIAAVAELGLNLAELRGCKSRACLAEIERRSRNVLSDDWKPISIFPDEAKRFR